jgi:hypothetical protein
MAIDGPPEFSRCDDTPRAISRWEIALTKEGDVEFCFTWPGLRGSSSFPQSSYRFQCTAETAMQITRKILMSVAGTDAKAPT